MLRYLVGRRSRLCGSYASLVSSTSVSVPNPRTMWKVEKRTYKDFVKHDFTFPGKRNLDEIVKLPLLKVESKEALQEIWNTQHAVRERRLKGSIFF